MTYLIQQSSEYVGKNRWKWQTWIDASDSELDQITDVIWYLHETFPQSVVKKTTRKNNFRLSQTGWGIFLVHAEINLKNSETIDLSHQLSFESPDVQNTPTRDISSKSPLNKQLKVFLSYGAEDTELAKKVQENLQGFGYQVLDINSCQSSMPLKLAQQKLMRESDLIMGLVTSDVASPYVLNDLNRAKQSNKPAVALVGKNITPIGLDSELNQISYSIEADDDSLENFFEIMGKL